MLAKPKQSKIKKIILPTFIGLIMILSVVGFALTYNSGNPQGNLDSYTYNGHQYTRTDAGWVVKVDEQYASFSYGPKDLEDIKLPGFSLPSKIYVAYDPDDKDQNIDFIIQKLNNILLYKNTRPVSACIKESKSCPNIPVINCNSGDKVIAIYKADKSEVTVDNNCLNIKGSTLELNRITDKLAMHWLGLL